jgi:hypothetical protein
LLSEHNGKSDFTKYSFYKTGCWYQDQKEKLINQNFHEYIKNERSFHLPAQHLLVNSVRPAKPFVVHPALAKAQLPLC